MNLRKTAAVAACMCALCAQAAGLRYGWKSLEDLEKAAREGKPSAQADLGRYYAAAGEYEEAFPWLEKAAKKGDPDALYMTGYCYETGKCGRESDLNKAVRYYKKAAAKNSAAALYEMAVFLHDGKGMKQNKTKAVDYMKRAADKGSVDAWKFLAEAYYGGKEDGFKQDYKEALKYWKKLAAEEDAAACYNLGNLYYNGYGVAKDAHQAFSYDLKAAGLGLAAAQYRVGKAYLDGDGVEADAVQGAQWLEKAAAQGYDKAGELLGGINYYVYKGPDVGAKSGGKVGGAQELERQARAGDPGAQYMYGSLCEEVLQKQGVMCDPLEWYRKAAGQGSGPALFKLGNAYYKGKGVPKDEKKAEEYFLRSAEREDPSGQIAVGLFYETGDGGLPKDLTKAEYWYKRAAEKGDTKAKSFLGNFYVHHAKDGAQSTRGLDLLEEASLEGDARAQYLYGMYLVEIHPAGSACWEKGAGWLEKAAANGSEDAAKFLKQKNISADRGKTAGKDVKCAAPEKKK